MRRARLARDHLLRQVHHVPAFREFHAETQDGMEKHVAANDAVFRIVADDEAVDLFEILIAIARRGRARELRRDGRGALDAGFRRRMRGQSVGHAALAERIHALERGKKSRYAFGIPTGVRSVLDANTVRFQFVVAAVLQEQHAEAAAAFNPGTPHVAPTDFESGASRRASWRALAKRPLSVS